MPMSIRETYVKVREAAKILGVAPNTVRSWGATGKIPEYRHPANGYRMYKRIDLERLIQKLEGSLSRTEATQPKRREHGR
jgi:DNA-binding transcriptional MerR regulator